MLQIRHTANPTKCTDALLPPRIFLLGTAAVTTRGFKEEDIKEVAKLIALTLKSFDESREEVVARVAALCKKYPLYE